MNRQTEILASNIGFQQAPAELEEDATPKSLITGVFFVFKLTFYPPFICCLGIITLLHFTF